MGVVTKFTDSVKVRLGSLGVLDLLWRVPEATPGDGTIADIVLATLSAGAIEISALESVTLWILIGYATFALAPKAYPGLLFPRERYGFRLLFTSATITMLLVLFYVLETRGTGRGVLVLLWLVVFAGVFAAYLHYLGWRIDPGDSRVVKIFTQVTPQSEDAVRQEARQEWKAPGWHGVFNRVLAWGAIGGVAAIPGFLAAIVTFQLQLISPYGESLFLFAVIVGAVRSRTSLGSNRSPMKVYDIETYMFESISQALRSLSGMILLFFIITVTFLSLGVIGIVVSSWLSIAGEAIGLLDGSTDTAVSGVELYLSVSVIIGSIILNISGLSYISWAGLREIPRIAAFVDMRQGTEPRTVPSRPVGFIFPGVILILLSIGVSRGLTVPVEGASRLFAAGWPVLLGGLLTCWWRTHRRDRMPVTNDHHVIIWSVAIVLAVIAGYTGFISPFGVVVVCLGYGYTPFVVEYADRYRGNGLRQYATGAYSMFIGTIVWMISFTTGEPNKIYLIVSGGVLLVFGTAIIISRLR